MRPHRKQSDFIKLIANERLSAFLGGIGAGKTTAGSLAACLLISQRPGMMGLIFANTATQLNRATLKVFREDLLRFADWESNVHFVVNRDPRDKFGYKSKFTSHEGIWSFWNGHQIMTYSLESQIRGVEVSWAWGDEIQDAKADELNVVIGRVRQGGKPKIFYTLTPPAYNPEVRELIFGENSIPKVVATTHDNAENLPEGFIDTLRSSYSSLVFDREVLAKDVRYVSNRWMFAFDSKEVQDKVFQDRFKYNAAEPVYLSFDFNKDPLTCIAGQRFGQQWQIFNEYYLEKSNLLSICQRIVHDYGYSRYYITGDYTGRYGSSVVQDKYLDFYEKIAKELKVPKHNFALRVNPHLIKSREHCNSLLEHSDLVYISPKCVHLIDDLLYVSAKEDGSIDKTKDSRRTHVLDCIRYFFNIWLNDKFNKDLVARAARKSYNRDAAQGK